jgi:hypothetical protein
MVEYASTNKVTGTRVGTELSADVRWRVDRHLLLGAIAAESWQVLRCRRRLARA